MRSENEDFQKVHEFQCRFDFVNRKKRIWMTKNNGQGFPIRLHNHPSTSMTKEQLRLGNGPKKIRSIHFGIMPPEEICEAAEMEVCNRELYNPTDMKPIKHGSLDRRLGTSTKDADCETCGAKLADCPGHFGFVKLVLPVYHIGFFKAALTILQDVCKECCRVLLDEKDRQLFLRKLRLPKLDSLQRAGLVKAIHDKCRKVNECMHCGALNGTVRKAGVLRVVHERFRQTKRSALEAEKFRALFENAIQDNAEIRVHLPKAQDDINPLDALRIFEQVTNDDCELLGITVPQGRPERFIWTTIPVPPACIRPSVAMTVENGTNEDDLTTKLADIVYTNNIIKDAMEKGVGVSMLMEDWDYLQLQCALYINSELPGLPMAMQTGKPIRGLCQRLKGKMGRFRGNLSGKRVDFSSRTVISPDPNLRIDEVGVPVYVAKTLTYPETVTAFNMERLRGCVINGPDAHPGANFIQNGKDGLKRYLRFGDRRKIAKDMRIGDVVERHLRDGDVVLFNRQPSLHKLSIMAHFAVVRPWRTFRFNECACTPYNADFDGDEMNLHLPQTEEAKAEAIELMGLRHNLVTPRNGQPLIAAMQDFITASHLLTNKDVFYSRDQFAQIACLFSDALLHIDMPRPAIIKPRRLWTGKQVIGVLLKPNKKSHVLVNIEAKCRTFQRCETTNKYGSEFCPVDGYLIIHNSELLSGTLDKSNIGGDSKHSIFYVLMRDYGSEYAVTCMTRLSKLCARWLANRGFSIGIEDVQAGPRLRELKKDIVKKGYAECDKNIEDFKEGRLQNQPGCTAEESLEAMISGTLRESGMTLVRLACKNSTSTMHH